MSKQDIQEGLLVETRKIYTTVVIVAVVGLLFSCVAGALAGGLAGFLVGQRQARLVAERTLSGNLGILPKIQQLPGQGQQAVPVPVPGTAPSGIAGAAIVSVVPGTPAEQAGLQAGDVIVAIDRTPVDANHPLPDVIAQYQPGDRVTIEFWRDNQQQSVTVRLGTNPDNASMAYLGIYFEMQ
jgi:membrane-associated protease RseP (regulator of RpoE activity)